MGFLLQHLIWSLSHGILNICHSSKHECYNFCFSTSVRIRDITVLVVRGNWVRVKELCVH